MKNMQTRKEMKQVDWINLAEKLDAESHAKWQEKEDSFTRCDTDGFLTQQVSEMSSAVASSNASICRKFGKTYFMGLYLNNKRVKAKQIETKCQYSGSWKTLWLLHDDEQSRFGNKKFLPCNHGNGRSRILNQFNLKECDEIDDAWATFSKGYCPSPSIIRVSDEWGTDATRIQQDPKHFD